VLVSALGPRAVSLAARIGDGYISTAPDAGMVRRHLSEGGKGQAGFLEFYRREVLPRLG
jgi:alkanesulfonate monooxygenase SsuD/methylene tetrahydromethanopterin reductase-like flavin-dependent oxidoreductase (luciferase family)